MLRLAGDMRVGGTSYPWPKQDISELPWKDVLSDNEGWSRHDTCRWSRNSYDADPPEWNGQSESFFNYIRKVRIWVVSTYTSPYKQGLLLLGKLSDDAFEKMESALSDTPSQSASVAL